MQMYELINRKKRGEALTRDEIRNLVEGFTQRRVPDYQMSALLMAICFRGMNQEETTALTIAMVDSGETVDLSGLGGLTVDKHSTGGVGDKTTLIVMPIVAALGLTVAKMSGRGLGHTGGTVDKLESIPGFRTDLPADEFLGIVKRHGLCIAGQSVSLAPADKKLYALRDVTATVDSIPLIAASIMSKKIAAGAEIILLDVKTGSGAFMKDPESAKKLARVMVNIGNDCGRNTAAIITDMSVPLGCTIGNSLEIEEVVAALSGKKMGTDDLGEDLYVISIELAANLLSLAGRGSMEECRIQAEGAIKDGSALRKLADMVESQGGDRAYIENPDLLLKSRAKDIIEVRSSQDGYIFEMDTEAIGLAAMALGAGRETPEAMIYRGAGIILHTKVGDWVDKGQVMATFYVGDAKGEDVAVSRFLSAVRFSDVTPEERILVYCGDSG